MRIIQKVKDGGPESTVDAYFLFEIKWLMSIAILRFNEGSRTNYHSHAFNALTWFISGDMDEQFLNKDSKKYKRSFIPKYTPRLAMHRVMAHKRSWCFTIRGPWINTWKEYNPVTGLISTLTHGHKEIDIG